MDTSVPQLFPDAPVRELILPFKKVSVSLLLLKDVCGLAADEASYPEGDIYWGELWPAGMALAEAILSGDIAAPQGPEPILEIGSGSGIVSIALALAMKAGLRPLQPIIATDREERARILIAENARRNGVGDLIRVERLDWKEKWPTQHRLILAADCLYQPDSGWQLASCIAGMLCGNGRALVVDPDRWSARQFSQHAQQAGLEVRTFTRSVPYAAAHRGLGAIGPAGTSFDYKRVIDCIFYDLRLANV